MDTKKQESAFTKAGKKFLSRMMEELAAGFFRGLSSFSKEIGESLAKISDGEPKAVEAEAEKKQA